MWLCGHTKKMTSDSLFVIFLVMRMGKMVNFFFFFFSSSIFFSNFFSVLSTLWKWLIRLDTAATRVMDSDDSGGYIVLLSDHGGWQRRILAWIWEEMRRRFEEKIEREREAGLWWWFIAKFNGERGHVIGEAIWGRFCCQYWSPCGYRYIHTIK